MNINYYDLYYTVIKNRNEKEVENYNFEDRENDLKSFNDFITPNHNTGGKIIDVILKKRKMRSQINHFN